MHRLLMTNRTLIASTLFTTLASIDCEEIALVQQCHFLERVLKVEGRDGLGLTDRVLALSIAEEGVRKLVKSEVAKADHQKLLDEMRGGSSSSTLVQIRETITWSKIWDQALTYGPKAVDDTFPIIVHSTIY